MSSVGINFNAILKSLISEGASQVPDIKKPSPAAEKTAGKVLDAATVKGHSLAAAARQAAITQLTSHGFPVHALFGWSPKRKKKLISLYGIEAEPQEFIERALEEFGLHQHLDILQSCYDARLLQDEVFSESLIDA